MNYYYDKKDEDLKSKYITSVERDEETGNYVLTFADGEVYDNIPIEDNNTQKIEERLAQQASYAVEQKVKLKRSQTAGTITRFTSTLVAGVAAGFATFHFTNEPVLVATAAGACCIGGLVWAIRHKQEFDSKVDEVTGFEQRIAHQEEVSDYLDSSPNAYRYLEGDTPEEKTDRMDYIQGMKRENRNPFGFIEIDNGGITNDEMAALMRGAAREEELGFTYVKSNSR